MPNDPAPRRNARDLVAWVTCELERAELFYGHGTARAADEAMALVMWAMGVEPSRWAHALRRSLERSEVEAVISLLRRRVEERVPLPYLTREAWFAGLPFYVDERVLVPRSPIAEWIERGFSPWVAPDAGRILDLGTGSGCVAIACAYEFEQAEVIASDVSPAALEVADINRRRHAMAERVRLVRSDLFEHIEGEFDLIVSNPPYLDAEALAALPAEFRHEPSLALAGGGDGLDLVRPILAGAKAHLSARGVLVLEMGASRAALERAYPRAAFVWLDLERGGENVLLAEQAQLP